VNREGAQAHKETRMTRVKLQTSHGDIVLALDDADAPATVANFLQYVRDGHYDNTVFHRVIDGFMIQGGGFEPGMRQKPTRKPVAHEGANGLKNKRHTVAMARTGDPHSATAQFFINVADNDFLDFKAPGAAATAGATRCSGRSSKARTSSTASRASRPAAAACTRTCRRRTW